MSDAKMRKWPRGTGPSMMPRRWDPPEDRTSISMGINLWRQFPDHLNAQILVRAVVSTSGILARPAADVRKEMQQRRQSVR